ncbi:hypothetical protein GWK47_032393 [Chionoecetes opilio]|uniref:Uncharacterized protein n=1 Tax=Chionoecetes opilio TaxID=41210 RepID=A0A8J4YHZ7_CHIOP|nr:hypothetical protein GWK47_032393 [Chionoecetes opilio]
MNRPCGVQRVWVMVQRCCSPTPDNTNTTAPLDDTTTTANNLIPRPDFSQNPRATVVEINVQHTCVNASMDLTPTVGSGIKFQNNMLYKNGINKSLYHNSPCMSHGPFNNSHQEALYTSHQGYKESDAGSKATIDSGKKNILPLSLSDNSDLTYRRPILETPVKTLKGEAIPVVETPVHSSLHEPFTPSKQLASQLGTFKLCDGAQDCMWYQVDTLLSGFRDMCAKS